MSYRMNAKRLAALLLPVAAFCLSSHAFAQSSSDSDGDGVTNPFDAFPSDARAVAAAFAPAQGYHGMMLFEDQWPEQGDLDFNDAVITYNYIFALNSAGQTTSVRLNINALALGGVFHNGLGLHLSVPTGSVQSITRHIGTSGAVETVLPVASANELTIPISSNLRELFANQEGTINSNPNVPVVTGQPLELTITFNQPVALDTGAAPYDLFIFRTEQTGHEIHRPEFPGTVLMDQSLFGTYDDGSSTNRHFVDRSGLPFVVVLPTVTLWPQEANGIDELYPNIVTFAASGGTQARDYYVAPTVPDHGYTAGANNQPPPSPSFAGPSNVPNPTYWRKVAVISGNATGYEASGGNLPYIRATGETFDLFGTASGAQALTNLYSSIDQYRVIIVPEYQGKDSAILSVMTPNSTNLVNWVRRGGVLYMGVHDDSGSQTNIFNPAGFAMSGADDRTDNAIVTDRSVLHTPNEIASQWRVTDSWERLSSFPTEATDRTTIIGNGTLTEFRMGQGFVLINGTPVYTQYSGWPGIQESYGLGTQMYQNIFAYLKAKAQL